MVRKSVVLRLLALLAVVALAASCGGAAEEPEEPQAEEADPGDDAAEEDPPEEETEDVEDTEDTEETAGGGDGTLRLGYLLPETGQLAFLGPQMIAAVELAVADLNEAGGVLGADVELESADEAGDSAVASEAVDRLLGDNVDAVIGAAASGMSLAVIDQIIGQERVQCSPSNTSPTFTDYDDNGYYFRTAPTDTLQAPVLAETIVGDGHADVVIMARSDDYGQGLADVTEEEIVNSGGTVPEKIIYDPEAQTFDAEVEQAIGPDPDAIAIIGFDESRQILQGLIEAGYGPGDFPLYGGESLRAEDLPEGVDPENPNVLDGLVGTAPLSRADEDFVERLESENPDLTDLLFAGESYDCVVAVALAAVAADSDDPADFADEIVGVTRDGTACESFEECVELLEGGEDIDYDGVSGPLDFTDAGEPSLGVYEVWAFEDGEIVTLDEVESTL